MHISGAFESTDLQVLLHSRGINSLVIAGMQTGYCIDATVRQASVLGFDVTVIADAHSTYASNDKTAAELINDYNLALQRSSG
jgi:nicotinamidase-related amidase